MGLTDIYRPIAGELGAVKENLRGAARSENGFVRRLADDLLSSPGKLLRPALVLFAARVGGKNKRSAVELASAIELLHLATLVQDDAIDKAELRRGKRSIQKRWGEAAAVLFGDYLFTRAFGILSLLNDHRVLRSLLSVSRVMAVGELEQIHRAGRKISTRKYFEIINKKTAALFEACCETGALVGKANAAQTAVLKNFGRNFGLGFQIVDDCLDAATEKEHLPATKKRAAEYMELGKIALDGVLPAGASGPFIELCDHVLARAPDA
ncbi:hypothetical protein A2625_00590 [candidate division WOR-1 bacterium RIFCSPHIGHO2_01_FULL_53_15]|uniref:Polyprenyl synthetase n=1 Tax=candidate division WOR-1 bacterium RIFCSPHIGHO2_01_FULL_53_15 TaxID=1802564 RepID=A0A1F4Q333_UNCSA|nr:MAG: hypothetical protein A2625_00590 [candidate division WOR-1 bacterium RIFCSPHIGHO2_01_FULL_53_15]OGC12663.1 MAG: hypothetical protein A3D23_02855 [candidate division WOR-1 bacterium RIFCSPHIGHO2_02_FULL_53_26]